MIQLSKTHAINSPLASRSSVMITTAIVLDDAAVSMMTELVNES